ncbi:MAG: hypothetical protein AB7Q27_01250 [Acidimicrobiia bacterium]
MTIDARVSEFIDDVAGAVDAKLDEAETAARVAEGLRRLLASPVVVPPGFDMPRSDQYAMYPLHVADDGSFSVAVAVWGVGQRTPIHDHLAWGVVGVLSGVEREQRYEARIGSGPVLIEERDLRAGDVVVCCTSDDDVHAVSCGGESNVVAIHVYGTDIGTALRHSYDPDTGTTKSFISKWCSTE